MQDAVPTIALRNRGKVTIVELLPDEILDEGVISHVEESLTSIADDMAPIHMLLCFTHVHHMSSGALGVLNRLKGYIEKSGGSLKLANLHGSLLEVFRITQLSRVFDIYPDHTTALASYR